MLGKIKVRQHVLVPLGTQVLYKQGNVVWAGPLGRPTEDVDYDEIVVSPADYLRIRNLTETQ